MLRSIKMQNNAQSEAKNNMQEAQTKANEPMKVGENPKEQKKFKEEYEGFLKI